MLIRPAEREDIPAIAQYISMAEGEMVRFFTGTDVVEDQLAIIAGYIDSRKSNRYNLENCLVAEVDGKPAGMILSFPADDQRELDQPVLDAIQERGHEIERLAFEGEKGTYYLSTMGVYPKARGKGVGSSLMRAAFKLAKEKGFDRVSLLVDTEKPKAKKLYMRLGFAPIGEVEIGGTRYIRMARAV